ncbi:archaetidylserine decarboxylase [Moraxella haemolytica]|uniref:archaetidylserine decarboxylase n=1 Tax=Moraxella TaxID=475 RepID=UPI0025427743|nr:archaetidylserine decarboxylase [Moraxella sp. ZY171148]WII95455.1 archaetidylserine decarboxylase [Moraxella sp. ZY171148]
MNLFTIAQNIVPQQTLSKVAGHLAKSDNPIIKKAFVHGFARAYGIDLAEYERGSLDDYDSFNDFFTRELKAGARLIDSTPDGIACPADGKISQIGAIKHGQLIQAKGRDYDVGQLLADFEVGKAFTDGSFATIYLAPTNYHRVHMPFDGRLVATRYVPGTLFSVNNTTALHVPDLFARNERLVCEFETKFGRAFVVLVGAMIVAGISSVATGDIKRTPYIQHRTHDIALKKGDELGRFYLGSTAIIVLPKSAHAVWGDEFIHRSVVKMGQKIGRVNSLY